MSAIRRTAVRLAVTLAALAAGTLSAAAQPPRPARAPLAERADTLFWKTLHEGAYDRLPQALALLQAAYLQNPRDPVTAAHVGFLHAWRVTERARLAEVPPTIVDEITLARHYFERSLAHDPQRDARVHGFAAAYRFAEAELHADSAGAAAALVDGRAAIERWPVFNLFTIAYPASTRPDTSAAFRRALEMQWRAVELCRTAAGVAIDRRKPGAASPLVVRVDDAGPKRACVNSWIAPHNLEGFLLNFGDMLVKAGEVATARQVYGWARSVPSYASWPYRAALEARIAQADENVALFRAPERRGAHDGGDATRRVMIRTPFSCTGCHQAK